MSDTSDCHECSGSGFHEPWCSAHDSTMSAVFYVIRPVGGKWEVGYYDDGDAWIHESDWSHASHAAAHAVYMNKGARPQ